MKNKFSKFINLQGKYLTSLLFVLFFAVGQMWGEEVKLVSVGTAATQSSPDFFDDKTYSSTGNTYSVNLSTSGTSKAQGGSYGSPSVKDYYYALGSACDMSGTPSNYFKVSATGCKISKIVVRAHSNSTSTAIFPAMGCVNGLPSTSTKSSKSGRVADTIITDQTPGSYGSIKKFDNATTLTYTFSTNVSEVYLSKQIKQIGLSTASAWSNYPSSSAQSVCLYGIDVYVVPTETPSTSAPTITAPTTDQSASYTVGDVISALEVTATGSPDPTYQWYYNSSASTEGATSLGSGAQTASYTPSNAAASDLYYYCVATNSEGSATSPYFHVTVSAPSATAPSFTSPASEPAAAEYHVGDVISALEVEAAGYPEPALQWYSNTTKSTSGATLLTGEESASYIPSNAAESDLYYYCVASNASGDAQSEYFHVTVLAALPPCYTFTSTNPSETATFAVDDIVPGSSGGSMKVIGNTVKNTAYGVSFESSGSAQVEVTLGSLMKKGTVISVSLWSNNTGSARTLKLNNSAGTTKATWSFTPSTSEGETKNYSYEVTDGDGLIGTNVLRLQRGSNIYLRSITVSNCGAELLALSSAVSVAGKATVTLSKSLVAAGGTATASYSDLDSEYEFDGWEITSGDATIADATAATAAITMGTTASTITLKLKAASVKYAVHFDSKGGSAVADQLVEAGEHASVPTAPTKFKYTFGGWSETDGGAAADLASVVINAEKTFYAIWTPKACPTSGTIYSFVSDGTKAPGSNTYCPASGVQGVVDIAAYATVSGGLAQAVHTTTSNNPAQIQTSTSAVKLSHADGYFRALLECPLQEGDTIKFVKTNKVEIAFDSLKTKTVDIASGTGANKDYYVVPAGYAGEDTIMVYYDGSSVTLTSLQVIRPVKYTVTFDSDGGSSVDPASVIKGAKVTAPTAPTKEYNTFVHWYKVTGEEGQENIAYDFDAAVNAAMTLKAKWTAWPTVTLNRGAAPSGDDENAGQFAPGAPVEVPACPFSYTDYNFNGWAYSPAVTMVDDTHFTMPSENLTLTAQWVDANNVAQIGSTKYQTLEAALDAVADGETIEMLQNYEFTLASTIVISGKEITLDLNGKTVTLNGNKASGGLIRVSTGATMNLVDNTVPDGQATINDLHEITYTGGKFMFDNMSNDNQLFTLEEGCVLNVNSGWYESNGRLIAIFDPNTTVNVTSQKAVLIATNSNVISGNGTAAYKDYVINISNGILLSKSTGGGDGTVIYHPNEGNLNISGGTLIAENGPAVVVRGGNTNVTGGIIEANGTGTYIVGDSQVEVPADGIVWDFKAAYPGQSSIAATVSAGTISSVSAVYAAAEPTTTEEAAIAVSGGTFNTPVAEELCANDYYPATKPSGKYGVTVAALSVNFAEEAAKTEGQKAWTTFLTDNHYDYNLGDGGEISWDKANAYDTGLKLKKSTNNAIYFTTEPGKLIELTVGNIAGMTIQINGGATQTITGGTNNDNLGVSYYYSDNAQAVVLKETSGNSGYNMLKSINIRDPYTVSFDANGGDAVASLKATPAITLPSATNGTQNFAGWYTDADVFVGMNGDSYTPTEAITLVAHWEALSTVNTLSDLKVDGVTVDGFDADVHTYYIVVPYGTAVADLPKITSATPTNANASVAIWPTEGPQWTDDFGGCYRQQANVTPQDPTAAVGYNDIRITIGPKDAVAVIAIDVPAGNQNDQIIPAANITGYIGGTGTQKIQSGRKLGSQGHYIGFTLANGETLKAGDVIRLNVTSINGATAVTLFEDASDANPVKAVSWTYKVGVNEIPLPDEAVGLNTLYIYRNDDSCNPTVAEFSIYRSINPILKKVTINGVDATPDNTNNIDIEVPASTTQSQLEAITYDWISNNDAWTAAHAPAVANAWEFNVENTITLTDKDNDQTVYTITVTKAPASNDATLSALTVNGQAIALADGVFEYSFELPYGTTVVPTVVATANHIAAIATVDPCTVSGATITVVPESGEGDKQVYTLNFTVSAWKDVAIWDGSTMSAVATSPDATGLTWAVTGFGSINSYTTTYGEKSYSKYLPSGGSVSASRNIALTVPAGYVAKFYVVMASHSDGSERGMFIGSNLVKDPDATSILELSNNDRDVAVAGMSEIVGEGTYYINPNASIDFQEIRAYVRKGYARTSMLGNGVYGTVCVPNNVAIEDIQGVTVYELMGREPQYGKLAFDEIISGELEAGAPYVFQAHGDKMIMFYGETHVDDPVDKGNGMYGTFEQVVLTELDDVYYFAQKALWSCDGAVDLTVGANRAYVKLGEVDPVSSPNPAPGRRRVTMAVNGEKVVTGVENLNASEQPVKLLINGQIFILRGEKLFDATGKLVK